VEVVIASDASGVADLASSVIIKAIQTNERPTLGLATGSSPLATYRKIAAAHRSGQVSFDAVSVFMLAESLGLPADHPQLYRNFLRRELLDQVGVHYANVNGPNVFADDLVAECAAYEQRIEGANGIDVQLLGIGSDGHIGFNEPGSSLGSRTRIKTLHMDTVRDNARFFDSPDDVPHHVITMGLGTILRARHLLMIASGEGKADAVAAAIEGPLSASCPGSVLQLHAHATVIVDEAAAQALSQQEYYRHAYANKPAWQHL